MFSQMEVTSRDGNMVVDFYPVKTWDNKLINNRMLKVLSFKGDTQKKMIITRDEFYYQIREYIKDCGYKVTSEYMSPQFINQEDYCNV
tara:strand:+ start:225 stop:488 length:264 start_codon:yes stop_codon:yes gene_type:complete